MEETHWLKVVDVGIDTHQELVVYMRDDCHVCLAEGFTASSRVAVSDGKKTVTATINVVDKKVLHSGEVGLSKIALQRLNIGGSDRVLIQHAPVLNSLSAVRKKIFGHGLNESEIKNIIQDISAHQYSDIEIASFLSVCAGSRMNLDEIIYLTKAMVDCGKRLNWPGKGRIFDKHCIGGLPGNRTTPLIVSIVSAAGLVIPKTSSRAITSPAGTADTMEAITNVSLELDEMKRVVDDTGACLAWGGAVNLSPADDLLIRIERALELDGEGQLIASVLSKKIAAGSTHAIIDIPVGETAKVRSAVEADRLASLFTRVGEACGIHVRCILTDGSHPVGSGIGPVEEARDLIAVLQGKDNTLKELRERAVILSANLFDLADGCGLDDGMKRANLLLDDGSAWRQFQKIVEAQGGFKMLPKAKYKHSEMSPLTGVVKAIDNRKLARLAKLAGAPSNPAAGIRLHANVGDSVDTKQPLFSLYCESTGERDYALEFYQDNLNMFNIGEES
jgi:thymidine phosphorylase